MSLCKSTLFIRLEFLRMKVLHLYNQCSGSQVIVVHQGASVLSSLMKRPVEFGRQLPEMITIHSRCIPVGPSSSNNAQGSNTSAPALVGFPAPPDKLLDVSPGVTKFTLIPSPLNSCASEMVYELRAALLELYAAKLFLVAGDPIPNFLLGSARNELDPNRLLTFTMTPLVDLRTRGSRVTVVCMTPK